jgi:hypothetical protein
LPVYVEFKCKNPQQYLYTFGIDAGFGMPASVLQGTKYALFYIIVAAWSKVNRSKDKPVISGGDISFE